MDLKKLLFNYSQIILLTSIC